MLEKGREYKFIALALVVFLTGMAAGFGRAYFDGVLQKLGEMNWWIENTVSLLVFGFFVSFLVSILQKQRDLNAREPFEDWKVVVVGIDTDNQEIHWSDMEKFLYSDFEQWKFVKSLVGNYCRIKTPNIKTAKQRWLEAPTAGKSISHTPVPERIITIDLSKMTSADVSNWLLTKDDETPKGWSWQEVEREKTKPTEWRLICDTTPA